MSGSANSENIAALINKLTKFCCFQTAQTNNPTYESCLNQIRPKTQPYPNTADLIKVLQMLSRYCYPYPYTANLVQKLPTLSRYCRPYQGTANIIEILLSLSLYCQPSSETACLIQTIITWFRHCPSYLDTSNLIPDTVNLIKVANLIEILLSPLSLHGQLGSDTGQPNSETANFIQTLQTLSRYCKSYRETSNLIQILPTLFINFTKTKAII